MEISLQFANQVLQLNRKGMTIAAIAKRLNWIEAEVLNAHRWLGIVMDGESVNPNIPPFWKLRRSKDWHGRRDRRASFFAGGNGKL